MRELTLLALSFGHQAGGQFPHRVAVPSRTEIGKQKTQALAATHEAAHTAVELNKVAPAPPPRHMYQLAKAVQIDEMDSHPIIGALEHQVGFLQIRGEQA